MSPHPIAPAAAGFLLQVERLYAALLAAAPYPSGAEPSLGGKLLYAGELNANGRALLVAANIAGASSLAATADRTARKQAIRDGVADFLVATLDEALRILKNEIRKQETVAVCVAAAPEAVEREMLERGVLPDLLAPYSRPASSPVFGPDVPRIKPSAPHPSLALLAWTVSTAPAKWLPRLDTIALDCLDSDSSLAARSARRWLRLAPRYLGRLAQGVHLLHCGEDVAREFAARVQLSVQRGEIEVQVRIRVNGAEQVFPAPSHPEPPRGPAD